MLEQIVTARMTGIRKRESPRRRCIEEFEEDMKLMGVGNWHTMVTHRKEWRSNLLEANIHDGL
jgi:hypothetical protein